MDEVEKRLKNLREIVAPWVGSADGKATGLLAVAGALLAAIAFASAGTDSKAERWFVYVFCVLAVLSIASSAMVLIPRVNREKMLKKKGAQSVLATSPTFFGDLARLNYAQFQKTLESPNTEERASDALEQTYVLCIIAAAKMRWMRASVILLLLSLVAVGGFVTARAAGAASSEDKCTTQGAATHSSDKAAPP
jgi:heme A synthase